MANAHMNSGRLWEHTQDLHKFKPENLPAQRKGRRHKCPPLTRKLFVMDSCREKETIFLQWHDTELIGTPQGSSETQDYLANTKQTPWVLCCFLRERKNMKLGE